MKIQVVYSSLTGCTRKLANAIFDGLPQGEKSIHDLKDGTPTLDGDIILVGYWGVSGGPCEEVQKFLRTIENKAVGVFCTLGYYADSKHAFDTVQKGIALTQEKNQIIGSYTCSGKVSPKLIQEQGLDQPHTPTQQKELRWEIGKNHPTEYECHLAAERFRERVWLYERCQELGIPFQNIL